MKKILIIEDDVAIRETVADILELEGYDYRQASNGREGVQVARDYHPDLILCDVMMPELNGYGVLLELQSDPQTDKIPFIFLTARATRQDLRKAMSMGADDYITKPFTSTDLVEAVENRLRKFEALYGAAAQEANDLRDYLNTTLPHELRTPLTGLIGYLEMLNLDYHHLDPESVRGILDRMTVAANRLYRLIENHLMHAQLRAATKDENIATKLRQYGGCENPGEFVRAVAEKYATHYQRRHDVRLACDNANIAILSDSFKKILEELIDNACKFSKRGTPIYIKTEIEEGYYDVVIQDHGRGIADEHLQLIGPNRQFDRSKYEQQGIGLGLTIAMQITEVFDGRFVINSEVNKGTMIKVGIPLL